MPLPKDRGVYVNCYKDPRERVWRADVRLNADDVGGGFTVRGTAEPNEHPADALLRAVLISESMLDNPLVASAMPPGTRARLSGVRILGQAARNGTVQRFAKLPSLSPAMRFLAEQLYQQAVGQSTALSGGPLCVHACDDGAIMGAHPWALYRRGPHRGRRKHKHHGARARHPAIMGWGLPSLSDIENVGRKFERMVGRAAKQVEKIPELKEISQQVPELKDAYAVLDAAAKLSKAGVHPKAVAAAAAAHQAKAVAARPGSMFSLNWARLAEYAATHARPATSAGFPPNMRDHRHAPGTPAPTYGAPPPGYGAPPAPAPTYPPVVDPNASAFDPNAPNVPSYAAPDGTGRGAYEDWQWQQYAAQYGVPPGGGGWGDNGNGNGWG